MLLKRKLEEKNKIIIGSLCSQLKPISHNLND